MTHGSLFSGIGGFDLAAEWMGWENKFHCEWNPFGQRVLKYYWPNAESFTDITKTDFTKYAHTIDILTGGFPCQPYSQAGKRKGKEDERHLWPQMLRAIKEISPSYIVGENVRGLTNWNGGLVFDEVCVEMENIGYQVAPVLIPASGVGAPHRRERIWFVAYRDSNGFNQCNSDNEINTSKGGFNALCDINKSNGDGDVADTNSRGLERSKEVGRDSINVEWKSKFGDVADTNRTNSETRAFGKILGQQNREKANGYSNVERRNQWENFPTVSPICNGDDGLSDQLDNITFSKWRNESIKAGGNAIVPQVAFQIFQSIQKHQNQIT